MFMADSRIALPPTAGTPAVFFDLMFFGRSRKKKWLTPLGDGAIIHSFK